MSRLSLLPRKFKKLFAVLLCYLLLLAPLTPAASAGWGVENNRARSCLDESSLPGLSLLKSICHGKHSKVESFSIVRNRSGVDCPWRGVVESSVAVSRS